MCSLTLNTRGGSAASRDEDLEALATMLEARAQLPACRGLDPIKPDGLVDEERSEAFRCRLLRALLPSMTEFGTFQCALKWHAA